MKRNPTKRMQEVNAKPLNLIAPPRHGWRLQTASSKFASLLIAILLGVHWLAACPARAGELPPASPEKLPRWRGFNLLEKFNSGRNAPFIEEDFQLISKLGFNFVRLPMDYRCWIKDGNWEAFDERTLKEIDQAVA
ncbi:MAG: hypothetical protein WCS99_18865, partial [Limisphaerales bacterium]